MDILIAYHLMIRKKKLGKALRSVATLIGDSRG